MLTKIELKKYCSYLKEDKYKGIVQDVKLEYCTDNNYLILNLLRIRKPMRNLGWGSIVLQEIVQHANLHNVQIRLYATNIYGMEINRLYGFYKKHGFVLIGTDNDEYMIYQPKNY